MNARLFLVFPIAVLWYVTIVGVALVAELLFDAAGFASGVRVLGPVVTPIVVAFYLWRRKVRARCWIGFILFALSFALDHLALRLGIWADTPIAVGVLLWVLFTGSCALFWAFAPVHLVGAESRAARESVLLFVIAAVFGSVFLMGWPLPPKHSRGLVTIFGAICLGQLVRAGWRLGRHESGSAGRQGSA